MARLLRLLGLPLHWLRCLLVRGDEHPVFTVRNGPGSVSVWRDGSVTVRTPHRPKWVTF